MPGQRRAVAPPRARGSRLPRLFGIALVIVLAGGGAFGYMAAMHARHAHHAAPLPDKVLSSEPVGLVAQAAGDSGPSPWLQLLGYSGPQFSPVPKAEVTTGTGQWTASAMAGNSYIFVFVATGRCLTAAGPSGQATLALKHCDLSASQRWRRTGPLLTRAGHSFYEYKSLATGSCLARTSELPGPAWSAALVPCAPGQATQLISFWWVGLARS